MQQPGLLGSFPIFFHTSGGNNNSYSYSFAVYFDLAVGGDNWIKISDLDTFRVTGIAMRVREFSSLTHK